MKLLQPHAFKWILTVCALPLALSNSQAQTSNALINAFDTAAEVTDTAHTGANAWGNWFGTAYYQVLWDASDASNNLSSGSLQVQCFFPNSGIGGCCGPQFVAQNGFNGIIPPLPGNGAAGGRLLATNIQFDLRFDPISFGVTNATSTNWPSINVGTRGIDFGQHSFGTTPASIDVTNTNWIHISIPIPPSGNWTTIPEVFFNLYGPADTGWLNFYVDNIIINMGFVPAAPPTITSLVPARPALRFIAGPSQFNRSQLSSVDTQQSWVGAGHPVSYSFTVSEYDINPTINELHVFLLPTTPNGVTAGDPFVDFTGGYNLRLQITGGANGTDIALANLAWKTNSLNNNPTNIVLNITNSTLKGTWTLTFNNDTSGTLTAPGASPVAFTIPADVAPSFANPLVYMIGLQPNPTANLGQQLEMTHISSSGVAGVPINTDWLTATNIDSTVWSLSAAVNTNFLVQATTNSSLWLKWTFPDSGGVVAAKEDLASSIPWKSALFYNNSNSLVQITAGSSVLSLLPQGAMPSVDGTTNGVRSAHAFFQLQSPGPAE